MRRKILGLDIRYNGISAVLVGSGIKGRFIETYAYVPISDYEDFQSTVAASLEKILEKIDVSGATCIASYPADRMFYRNIKVPFKGRNKIRQILPFELEPSLPVPVENLIIDFHILKLSDPADNNDILAACLEKNELQSCLNSLASFNINPEVVTPGGYSMALCLTNLANVSGSWLLADIDAKKCTLFAAMDDQIFLIRSFPVSGDKTSKAKSICTQIIHTCYSFEEISPVRFRPDSVLISDPGVNDSDFAQEMSKFIDIPVKKTDLAKDLNILFLNPKAQPWEPHRLDNALSLALVGAEGLSGINFRKGPFAAKKFWVENKNHILKTGTIAALAILLFVFSMFFDAHLMEKKSKRLDRQITHIFKTTFPDVKKIVDPYQQMRVKVKEAEKSFLLPGDNQKQVLTIDILNDISRLISKKTDVNINRFVIGAQSVLIAGDTDTYNSVDAIKSSLEKSDVFKKITISSTSKSKTGNSVSFKLKIQL